MENGNCAYLPKYKRRRVSAVRDYPPGCGRFAPPIVPKPADGDGCFEKVDNLVGSDVNADVINNGSVVLTEIKHESPSPGLEGVVGPVVVNEQKSGIKFVSDHFTKSDQVGESCSVESKPLLAGLEVCVDETVVEPVKGLDLEDTSVLSKVVDTSRIIGMVQRNYPPRRKILAVRDFPPFCGRNSSLVVREECEQVQGGEVIAQPEFKISGPGKYCTEEYTVIEMVKNDAKQMGVDVQGRDSQSCGVKRKFCAVPEDNVQAGSDSLAMEEIDNTDEVELFYQNQIKLAQEDVQEKTGVDNFKSSIHKHQLLDGGFGDKRSEFDSVDVQGPLALKSSLKQGHVDCRPNKSGSSMSELQRRNSAVKIKKKEERVKGTETSIKKNSSLTGKPFEYKNQAIPRNKVTVDHGKEVACNLSDSKAGEDNVSDARRKVKQALELYRNVYNELFRESKSRRIDLEAAKILKERGGYVNIGKQITGPVPGVEVGDKFHYWVELNIVGLHRQSQGGIDYVKDGQHIRATSIVASGSYDDDTADSDFLIYTGAGGNMIGKKEPEDQKLERGNLALKNSTDSKKPVRVIRGFSSSDARKTYFYDGLYTVDSYWQEKGPHGKLIFKFKLVRNPNQPVLKKLKKL